MALIACICPHCGGEVQLDDSLVKGYCSYCGCQIINDGATVGEVRVTMDKTPEVVSTLKLAKYSMHDGDINAARVLLDKAMLISSENSDVWYMDAVLDRRNAASDVERAKRYPSLGIFGPEDMDLYKDYDADSKRQTYMIISTVLVFFAIFAVLPVALIFEKYLLIPIVFVVGILVITVPLFVMKKRAKPIPSPTFNDETSKAQEAALEMTQKK